MIRLDAERPATFCDGVTRRDFLHAGALAALGLTLPGWTRAKAPGGQGQGRQLHHAVPGRRPQPDRHLGPEAERPGRGARAVQAHRHQRPGHADQRNLPEDGPARRQVLAGALRLPHGHGGPRHRPPDDADGPAVHRRHRAPARRLHARLPQGPARRSAGPRPAAAAHRPHRRQPAARPAPPATSASSTTRSSSTPTRPLRTSRCPTCCRRTTSPPCAPSAARSCATPSMARWPPSRSSAQAKQLDDNFNLAYRLMSSQRPGRLRPGARAGRRCATATAARASARAA